MNVEDELKRLSVAAVDIAMIQKPETRHKGGWWLNGELVNLYESHLFTEDQRLDFMALVKVLVDVIFRDAIEGDDMVADDTGSVQDLLKSAGVSAF